MSYQNISYILPQADIDAVKAAITTINNKLPFLVQLDASERKALFKLGPKSADFVADASAASTNFPNILPPSFDKVEYNKDTTLFKVLGDIKQLMDSLKEKIDNTYTAVGSEAMEASLEVYAYVQTASGRTPGLKSVSDKLKERFKAQRAAKPTLLQLHLPTIRLYNPSKPKAERALQNERSFFCPYRHFHMPLICAESKGEKRISILNRP